MECRRAESKTSSATPSYPRRTEQCRSNSRPRSTPLRWQSEESLPANAPGSAPPEGPSTRQNTSRGCPYPLVTARLRFAYSKCGSFICVGPGPPAHQFSDEPSFTICFSSDLFFLFFLFTLLLPTPLFFVSFQAIPFCRGGRN